MLVEAGWAAARSPGPLRSFFLRVQSRRGQHVAAVATARKLTILIWHLLTKNESYLWARPALHARKLRNLELKAGHKPARGQKGMTFPQKSGHRVMRLLPLAAVG
jgi:transposase